MSAYANSCIFVAVNTILQYHCITCFRNVKLWILGMTRVEYLDLPKVSINFALPFLGRINMFENQIFTLDASRKT